MAKQNVKAGQAAKQAEDLASKIRSLLGFYNDHVNEKIAVKKVKITAASKSETDNMIVTRKALDLVIEALKDPTIAKAPDKPDDGATKEQHDAYNAALQKATATKRAVRLFSAIGCPASSLPTIKIGRGATEVAPSEPITDAEAFIKSIVGE